MNQTSSCAISTNTLHCALELSKYSWLLAIQFPDRESSGITLVASGRLQVLYRLAFDSLSVAVQSIDAEEAVRRGLSMAAEAIWTL